MNCVTSWYALYQKAKPQEVFYRIDGDAPDGFGGMEREKLPCLLVSVGMSVKLQMVAAINSGLKQKPPLEKGTVCSEKTIHVDDIHYEASQAAPSHRSRVEMKLRLRAKHNKQRAINVLQK